jgi:hypothetical protein
VITNVLNRQVGLQTATVTTGATGQTVTWSASATYYVRKIPVSVRTAAFYQQLGTVITHKFIFRGELDIQIGKHRIVDGSTYYSVAVTGQKKGDCTIVYTTEAL